MQAPHLVEVDARLAELTQGGEKVVREGRHGVGCPGRLEGRLLEGVLGGLGVAGFAVRVWVVAALRAEGVGVGGGCV